MQPRLQNQTPTTARCVADDTVLLLADVCFEMFSTRELRHPESILPELHAAFPEISEGQKLKALSIALSWKRILRGASRLPH
jgi:hypothetical protein